MLAANQMIHPDDETIVGLIVGELDSKQTREGLAHLARCEPCRQAADMFKTRLTLGDSELTAPPDELAEQAIEEFGRAAMQTGKTPSSKPARLQQARFWVPVSAAAAAIFLLIVMPAWQRDDSSLSRSMTLPYTVRIEETIEVRDAPSDDARSLASLRRGQRITVHEEQSGWYRVELADGTMGWVPAQHFR